MAHWLEDNGVGAAANSQQALYNQIIYLASLLYASGVPKGSLMATYCIAQCMFETADFTSAQSQNQHNYSGLRYAGQKGAKKGANGFATFDTAADWAHAYVATLHKAGTKGAPISAASAQDFYDRLLANKYFTLAEARQYSTGFNSWLKKVNATLLWAKNTGAKAQASGRSDVRSDDDKGIVTDIEAYKNDAVNWFESIPTWEKWVFGGAGVLLLVKMIK